MPGYIGRMSGNKILNLTFSLITWHLTAHIAIVRKVSRGRRNPPSMGSHVQEWLNYVCATRDEDFSTTDDILSTERTRADSTGSMGSRKSSSIRLIAVQSF